MSGWWVQHSTLKTVKHTLQCEARTTLISTKCSTGKATQIIILKVTVKVTRGEDGSGWVGGGTTMQ